MADHVAEEPMHPPVAGQLRVERSGQHAPLPNRHDPTARPPSRRHVGDPGQYLNAGTSLLHPGGADEHRPDDITGYPGDVEISLEGVNLATERIAAHHHVQRGELSLIRPTAEDFPSEQDHARARAVGGHSRS